jgi:hypothetical protein
MGRREKVSNPMAQLYVLREKPAVTHIGLAISIRELDAVWGSDQRSRPLTVHVKGRR